MAKLSVVLKVKDIKTEFTLPLGYYLSCILPKVHLGNHHEEKGGGLYNWLSIPAAYYKGTFKQCPFLGPAHRDANLIGLKLGLGITIFL